MWEVAGVIWLVIATALTIIVLVALDELWKRHGRFRSAEADWVLWITVIFAPILVVVWIGV